MYWMVLATDQWRLEYQTKLIILTKLNNLYKIDSFDKIWQLWQVALISTLNKTKMLEFGANFIGHMKYYEIPITLKWIMSWKNTKSSIICKKKNIYLGHLGIHEKIIYKSNSTSRQ